jgi:hypothetical protein
MVAVCVAWHDDHDAMLHVTLRLARLLRASHATVDVVTLSSARYELRMTTEHIEREVDAPVVVGRHHCDPWCDGVETGYGSFALTDRRLFFRAKS